jgi:hypothetical protein
MMLDGQELGSLVTANQRVWHTAERGEWTTDTKENSVEEMYIRERVKLICEVLCSRPGSGL